KTLPDPPWLAEYEQNCQRWAQAHRAPYWPEPPGFPRTVRSGPGPEAQPTGTPGRPAGRCAAGASTNSEWSYCSPLLFGGGRLGGKPGGNGGDVFAAHALGDGGHQALRVVLAGPLLPGEQLIADVAEVLAGDRGKYRAGTQVIRSMAARAGHNVLAPITFGGELLAALEQFLRMTLRLGRLASGSREAGEPGRDIGDLLIIKHLGKGLHAGILPGAVLVGLQLSGDITGIQPGKSGLGFAVGIVLAAAVHLVAAGADRRCGLALFWITGRWCGRHTQRQGQQADDASRPPDMFS